MALWFALSGATARAAAHLPQPGMAPPSVVAPPSAEASPPVEAEGSPPVEAEAAILMDVASGRVLYEKNADRELSPASTAKILTAMVALERAEMETIVTISPAAAAAEGSSMYLKAGDRLSMEELLYGLMLVSGNDAALAIAEHVAGSAESFAGLMNQKAAEAGAGNSRFRNPSGLPAAGQVTTARDLARIAAHALHNPTFSRIVATRKHDGPAGTLYNHNWILGQDGIDGVKTGYTSEAQHTYVASATRDGWRLVAVVLRDSKAGKWLDARALLDYGFSRYRPVRLLEPGAVAGQVGVSGGQAGKVPVRLADPVQVVLAPVRMDGSESVYLKVEAPTTVTAPVDAGQPLGQARVYLNGRVLQTLTLVAAGPVPAATAPADRKAPRTRAAGEISLWSVIWRFWQTLWEVR